MRTVAPMTEQFQHFVHDLEESFWGDLYGQARGHLGEVSEPRVVPPVGRDLPELRTFFRFLRHLWRKLRTTNVIERCFVNVESVDRIICAIFNSLNDQWRNRTLRIFTQAA